MTDTERIDLLSKSKCRLFNIDGYIDVEPGKLREFCDKHYSTNRNRLFIDSSTTTTIYLLNEGYYGRSTFPIPMVPNATIILTKPITIDGSRFNNYYGIFEDYIEQEEY